MIKKISRLLGNIVGRIIREMVEHLLTWGGIYLPAGLFSLVFAFDKEGIIRWGFIIIGILLTIVGLVAMVKAYGKAIQRDKEGEDRFLLLINELKGLRQDLRGEDKNEHTESD